MIFRKKHAVEAAYNKHSEPIFRFLFWQCGNQLLAEDLASEVFIRTWSSDHLFKTTDPNTLAILYSEAQNVLQDYWQNNHGVAHKDTEEPSADYTTAQLVRQSEQFTQLHAGIQRLESTLKTIVILRFIEHVPVQQVATIMQFSEAEIRSLQLRALQQLRMYAT